MEELKRVFGEYLIKQCNKTYKGNAFMNRISKSSYLVENMWQKIQNIMIDGIEETADLLNVIDTKIKENGVISFRANKEDYLLLTGSTLPLEKIVQQLNTHFENVVPETIKQHIDTSTITQDIQISNIYFSDHMLTYFVSCIN